ncbi:MAG: hypothetical protein WAN30_07650 [Acidimicrobiales bacterium]
MKHSIIKTITALSLVVGLGVSVPAVAYASSGSSSTSATTPTTPTAWTAFRAQWKTYVQGLEAINATYHSSIATAHATYQAALKVATTKAERQAARAALDASIVAALDVRISAITAAGDPPSPPAGFNGTAWVTSFQSINVTFRAAIVAAQTTYASALAAATTADERQAARGALETSVGEATTAHADALMTLGPPPAHPGQPS